MHTTHTPRATVSPFRMIHQLLANLSARGEDSLSHAVIAHQTAIAVEQVAAATAEATTIETGVEAIAQEVRRDLADDGLIDAVESARLTQLVQSIQPVSHELPRRLRALA